MNKHIAVFDIDGTLRQVVDPWMLLHNHLNTAEKGAEIYKAWAANEISYDRMCELDVALWKGISKEKMLEALATNPIRKGAKELVSWFKERGITCIGISTGLSFLNEITAKELGLDEVYSNEVLFENGICTGQMNIHVREESKDETLVNALKKHQIDGDVFAFGDGPADVKLFLNADFSVAVFPRNEKIAECADIVVAEEPLHTVLEQLEETFV
ncbi:HAD family hydrolase [Sediminitomix flava]|uniref:phosphoserine phosphatase n=1 Tax=Sediminitomix flava TaxID=379075 RepID=A0A315ZUG3_SEDFL|nr:HAD family phosphatase [Sediminitomix flava]PWJ39279.1 phosphoserine phosphatase [Sediminitomix flava]